MTAGELIVRGYSIRKLLSVWTAARRDGSVRNSSGLSEKLVDGIKMDDVMACKGGTKGRVESLYTDGHFS